MARIRIDRAHRKLVRHPRFTEALCNGILGKLIHEVAQQDVPDMQTAKEFVARFSARDKMFETTPEGLAAMRFSADVTQRVTDLTLVEVTLVPGGFEALFFDRAVKPKLDDIKRETEDYVESIEVAVDVGDYSHQERVTSEIAIVRCKAKSKVDVTPDMKRSAAAPQKSIYEDALSRRSTPGLYDRVRSPIGSYAVEGRADGVIITTTTGSWFIRTPTREGAGAVKPIPAREVMQMVRQIMDCYATDEARLASPSLRGVKVTSPYPIALLFLNANPDAHPGSGNPAKWKYQGKTGNMLVEHLLHAIGGRGALAVIDGDTAASAKENLAKAQATRLPRIYAHGDNAVRAVEIAIANPRVRAALEARGAEVIDREDESIDEAANTISDHTGRQRTFEDTVAWRKKIAKEARQYGHTIDKAKNQVSVRCPLCAARLTADGSTGLGVGTSINARLDEAVLDHLTEYRGEVECSVIRAYFAKKPQTESAECDLAIEAALTEYALAAEGAEPVPPLCDAQPEALRKRRAQIEEVTQRRLQTEDEDKETDRMDDPLFYRDDMQEYYDVLLMTGNEPDRAQSMLRKKFKVKELVVTPTGEVRAPGVVDRPAPPMDPSLELPPAAPVPPTPPPSREPAPKKEPKKDDKKESFEDTLELIETWYGPGPTANRRALAASDLQALTCLAEEMKLSEGTAAITMAKRAGVSAERAKHLWQKAGDLATKGYEDIEPESDQWYAVKTGIYKRMLRVEGFRWVANTALTEDVMVQHVEHEARFTASCASPLSVAPYYTDVAPGYGVTFASHRRFPDSLTEAAISHDKEVIYQRFRRAVNATFRTLREAVSQATVRKIGRDTLGRAAPRYVMRLRTKPRGEWTEDDWSWAGRLVRQVRQLRTKPGNLIDEGGRPTDKLIELRLYGHDPLRKQIVAEMELVSLQRPGWSCPRCKQPVSMVNESTLIEKMVEHTCGRRIPPPAAQPRAANLLLDTIRTGCQRIGEGPPLALLKAHRVPLEETEQHKRVPLWKSRIGGREFWVTSTHRAYAVSTTRSEAMRKHARFVGATA